MYFTDKELRCPCCGVLKMNVDLKRLLNAARGIANIPFVVTSGYRCSKHNKDVGGSVNSSHLKGLAVDISCTDSYSRMKIVNALLTVGFNRVGIGDDFVHADVDKDKQENVLWTY